MGVWCRLEAIQRMSYSFRVSADFAEVDILEEADKSDEEAQKFNLEWMTKVIYTIKPSVQ